MLQGVASFKRMRHEKKFCFIKHSYSQIRILAEKISTSLQIHPLYHPLYETIVTRSLCFMTFRSLRQKIAMPFSPADCVYLSGNDTDCGRVTPQGCN